MTAKSLHPTTGDYAPQGGASNYRTSRQPLTRRAADVASSLSAEFGAERDQVLQTIRAFEDSVRSGVSNGDYPIATQVNELLSGSVPKAVRNLQALSVEMSSEEEWSKDDAQRRLFQLQGTQVQVEAFPIATWPRFFGGLGSSILASGSALIVVSELRVWPQAIQPADWPVLAASVLLYVVGTVLVVGSLWKWRSDESAKRRRYTKDFGDGP